LPRSTSKASRASARTGKSTRGLILRDRNSNEIVGVEFWRASEQLPAAVLEALPEPQSGGTVIERQSA